MLCNVFKNSIKYYIVLIAVGVVSVVFGIVNALNLPDSAHDENMLMGMFNGFGAALIGIGIIKIVRIKALSEKQLKQKEIELNDERNIFILRTAHTVSDAVGYVILAVLAFIFTGMGYREASYLVTGAIYVKLLSYIIAYKYFEKKL